MDEERFKKACAEFLHYLKGLSKDNVDKIPNEIMDVFKRNAEGYQCDFDYTLRLRDLKLMPETKGLISWVYLEYWCETDEERKSFIDILKENDKKYKLEQYSSLLEEDEDS